jgi:hypothetical protein
MHDAYKKYVQIVGNILRKDTSSLWHNSGLDINISLAANDNFLASCWLAARRLTPCVFQTMSRNQMHSGTWWGSSVLIQKKGDWWEMDLVTGDLDNKANLQLFVPLL